MLTLAELKTAMGISGTSQDALLTRLLRNASATIRGYCKRYFGGVITANSVANPTVCTSIGHGLKSGMTIVFAGSNSTPSLNGDQVVTVIDADTFSVPADVTVAGNTGRYTLKLTEFYAGNGTPYLQLRQRPVLSVSNVFVDDSAAYGYAPDAFPASSQLTSGVDYALVLDGDFGTNSKSGQLLRLNNRWPAAGIKLQGMLNAGMIEGAGNIKVTYRTGYEVIPDDVVGAVVQLAKELKSSKNGIMSSESLDYYSYTRMSADELARHVGSVKSTLGRYRKLVI